MVKVPRLRDLRERRALTQIELAAAAGVGRMTVIRAEAGSDVFVTTVRKLAAALKVRPAALIEDGERRRGADGNQRYGR